LSPDEQITLADGRPVVLQELRQFLTYEGLLEGAPTPEMNAHHVQGVVAQQLRTALGGAVHLIEPAETPLEDHGHFKKVRARIPSITCVGRFLSYQPARVEMCASQLVIIWFQDSFAPPIADAALVAIRETPWHQLAHDFDF
jgi:hypothetical protein